MFGEDHANLARHLLVGVETRLHEDEVGTFPFGGDGRHRRPHAEFSRFIARRRDDTALARSANGDRLAAQLRIVALLDGGVEGVHVDVDDLALPSRLDDDAARSPVGVGHPPVRSVIRREHDLQATRPPSSFLPPLPTILREPSARGR